MSEDHTPSAALLASYGTKLFEGPSEENINLIRDLTSALHKDSPPFVQCNGSKDCFILLPSTAINVGRAFTLTTWLNIDRDYQNIDISLWKCISSSGIVLDMNLSASDAHPHQYNVTLTTNLDGRLSSTFVHKDFIISPNKYHLLTLTFIINRTKPQASMAYFMVDDFKIFETNSVVFPFSLVSAEYKWQFCSGLRGKLSSIAFYDKEVGSETLSLLHDLGPHMHTLDIGVCCPQSSFDTSINILGTVLTKGALALRCCSLIASFYLTAHHMSTGMLSYSVQGQLNPEHINMVPPTHTDKTLYPQLLGGAVACMDPSWSESWWCAGSCNYVLDVLWTYCHSAALDSPDAVRLLNGCLLNSLTLLSALISSAPNHREAFVQGHGFHMLSLCLEELLERISRGQAVFKSQDGESGSKPGDAVLTTTLIDKCFDILTAFGIDGRRGDALIASLQGLLLNLKLWTLASEDTVDYLLTRVIAVVYADSGEELYKNVGIQKVLDILRVYIAPNVSGLSAPVAHEPALQRLVGSGLRLLHICFEAAFTAYSHSNSSDIIGIDLVIAALDDSLHMLLVDGLLQVLNEMRFNAPSQLVRSFKANSFVENSCVLLLCRADLSICSRRVTTMLVLWYYQELTKSMPNDLYKIRYRSMLVYNASLTPPSAINLRKAKFRLGMDGSQEQFKPLANNMTKHWQVVNMVAQCLLFSCERNRGDAEVTKLCDDLLEVFSEEGALGRLSVWLTLPFLSALLPRSSSALVQQLLMSLCVALKTDEGLQSEVFCSLKDLSWIHLLVDIAVYGSMVTDDGEKRITSTFSEISLDALITIIEHKLRVHDEEAWVVWQALVSRMRKSATVSVLDKLHRRCASLLVQRLNRGTAKWPFTLIANVGKIISFLESDRVLGNIMVSDEILDSVRCEQNMLGLEYVTGDLTAVCSAEGEQIQIIGQVVDLMGKIRFSSKDQDFGGYELTALQPGLRIVLGCLLTTSEELADFVCHELYAFLKYIAGTHAKCSSEDFNKFILIVFSMLKHAISRPHLDEAIKGKYTALVYSYLQYFYALNNSCIHTGKHAPDHVVGIMNIVTTIDSHNIDIDVVFKLFNISMQAEDAISFAEHEQDAEDVTNKLMSKQGSSLVDFLTPADEVTAVDGEETGDADMLDGMFWNAPDEGEEDAKEDEDVSEEIMDSSPATLSSSSESVSVIDPLRVKAFGVWRRRRLTIAEKYVAVERERLKKFQSGVIFKARCTKRLWVKVQRKFESEVLGKFSVESSWKLGTDEGVFPGRERVVLRRKYNVKDEHVSAAKEAGQAALTVDKINEVLVNYIQKPRISDELTASDADPNLSFENDEAVAEDDEEDNKQEGAEAQLGHSDDDFQEGNRLVTGPCHSGARRLNFGVVKDEADVILVTPSGNYPGKIAFSKKDISFVSSNSLLSEVDSAAISVDAKKFTRRRWTASAISQIFLRRYRLRDTALEVFFRRGKHRNFFIDFGHSLENAQRRNEFARNLMKIAPKTAFKQWPSMSPYRLVNELGVLAMWQNGEISNYEYLMALNTCAGRSYNDLCQYPVMPWILADYKSETVDLSKQSSYRDLSKPMGAQNPDRLQEYIDRFESFGDDGGPDIPPFHYGSHYSTMVGVVLHYLVRLQPFASLHRDVQDGFDVPDRLFSSIPQTYYQNTHMLSEVKELTPEWFTIADFLRNINGFDLGTTHDQRKIGDVELPPWADGSAEKFIRINREALESDYVSAHLHEWVDLIFGYKQFGKDAVEAHNVFYYLTYYGAVDTSKLTDELRKATELQVAHFGSHPMQLFRYPHPERKKRSISRSLRYCFDSTFSRMVLPETQEEAISIDSCSTLVIRSSTTRILKVHVMAGRIVCILDNGVLEAYRYSLSELVKINLSVDQQAQALNSARRKIAESAPIKAIKAYSEKSSEDIRKFSAKSIHALHLEAQEFTRAFDQGDAHQRGRAGSSVPSPEESPITREASPKISRDGEKSKAIPNMIVLVDKDLSPFNVLPRVPVAPVSRSSRISNKTVLGLSKLTLFSKSGRLVLSAGHGDGRVVVREIDTATCEVVNAGDFRAHRHAVCSIATDCISDGLTEVVTSIDTAGQLMIWTVSRIQGRGIISRRPQRLFRCKASVNSICDLSWSLGIVVVAEGDTVTVFSIEKNEIIHRWSIRQSKSGEEDEVHALGIRKIAVSNEGFVVVSIEHQSLQDQQSSASDYYVAAFTLSGTRTGVCRYEYAPTFLSCHQRGSTVIVGLRDGTVEFLLASSVELLFTFAPHTCCSSYEGDKSQALSKDDAHAIIHVQVGACLICITAVSGDMFTRALPDFVKFERDRMLTPFSKLVNNPIQTVQQHAQNLSDAASTLKVQIDETLGELKKIDKSKILSGVSSFFGLNKSPAKK